ncbi:MAG: CopG family transcriptional regulator [Gemmatimonas sp.]
MKRTTIFLDDPTLKRLQQAAARQGVSSAAMIREALALYLAAPRAPSPVPSIAGQFSSGTSDTASNVDGLLWKNPHE